MRKRIMFTCLLAVMTLAASAQIRHFAKTGVTASRYVGTHSDGAEWVIRYNAGFGLDIPLHNKYMGFRPSLLLFAKGSCDYAQAPMGGEPNTTQVYLEVPLQLSYDVPLTAHTQLTFAAGPYVAYGVFGKTTFGWGSASESEVKVDTFGKDGMDLRRFDTGLSFEVDYEVYDVFFGLSYDQGFVPVHKRDSGYKYPCNGSVALHVGYYF